MNATPALTRSEFLEVYDKYVRDGTYVEAKKKVDAVPDPSRGYAYNRQKEQGIIHKFIQEIVPEQIRNCVVYAAFLIPGKPEDYFSREFGVIPMIGHFGLPQESRRMLGGIVEGSDLFLCPKAALFDVLDKAKDVIGEHFVYLSMNSLLRSTIPDDILDTSEYQRAFYCVSERSSDIALDLKYHCETKNDRYNLINPTVRLSDEIFYPKDFADRSTIENYLLLPGQTNFDTYPGRWYPINSYLSRDYEDISEINAYLYVPFRGYVKLRYNTLKEFDESLRGKDSYELVSPR